MLARAICTARHMLTLLANALNSFLTMYPDTHVVLYKIETELCQIKMLVTGPQSSCLILSLIVMELSQNFFLMISLTRLTLVKGRSLGQFLENLVWPLGATFLV